MLGDLARLIRWLNSHESVLTRIFHRDRWIWTVVEVVGVIGTGLATFGLLSLTLDTLWLRIILVIAVVAGFLGERFSAWWAEHRLAISNARHIITPALDIAVDYLRQGQPLKFKANIMMPVATGLFGGEEELQIIFHSTNMESGDIPPGFKKGEGAVGQAWRIGKAVLADLTKKHDPGQPDWNLTPGQKVATEKLKTVACFPVTLTDDGAVQGKIIAFLSFDSEDACFDHLYQQESQSIMVATSKMVSAVLGALKIVE